ELLHASHRSHDLSGESATQHGLDGLLRRGDTAALALVQPQRMAGAEVQRDIDGTRFTAVDGYLSIHERYPVMDETKRNHGCRRRWLVRFLVEQRQLLVVHVHLHRITSEQLEPDDAVGFFDDPSGWKDRHRNIVHSDVANLDALAPRHAAAQGLLAAAP